jgi:hypothetical protein
MIIRKLLPNDYDIIAWLNERQDFKLHNLSNSIIDRIVTNEDGPIAYGTVKKSGEAIILVNPEASLLNRSKALRELMKYAEFGASQAGCEQINCFVSDERIARILERHFGFIRTRDIVLSKNL